MSLNKKAALLATVMLANAVSPSAMFSVSADELLRSEIETAIQSENATVLNVPSSNEDIRSLLNIFPDHNLAQLVANQLGVVVSETVTEAQLRGITILQSWNANVSSLEGIQYLENLISLALVDGSISDLSPLEGLSRLYTLDLSRNYIEDVSTLASLTSLQSANLNYNRIRDLRPLQALNNNGNFVWLSTFSNQEIILSPVEVSEWKEVELFRLDGQRVTFWNNTIDDGSWNQPINPFQTDGMRFRALRPGNIEFHFESWSSHVFSGTFRATVVNESTPYYGTIQELFPDPVLAMNIAQQLGRGTTGAQIFEEELSLISSLNIGHGIESLTGIERLTALRTLHLGNLWTMNTEEFSKLQPLTNLTSLSLGNSRLTDISFLEGMNQLTYLSISGDYHMGDSNAGVTRVEDLSPLSTMESLRSLSVRNIALGDIAPLQNLTNLRELTLQWNSLTTINAISNLSNLTNLNLSGNNISDVSPLGALSNLREIDISNNRISDLRPLSALTIGTWDIHATGQRIYLVDTKVDTPVEIQIFSRYGEMVNVNPVDSSNTEWWGRELGSFDGEYLTWWNVDGLRSGDRSITFSDTINRFTGTITQFVSLEALEDIQWDQNIGAINEIFTDNTLANIVANHLNVSVYNQVTRGQLSELRGLSGTGVSNLEGVQYLSNLRGLSLTQGNIEDLSLISTLRNLLSLNLNGNRIRDARPLINMPNLDTWNIDLSNQRIYLEPITQFEIWELPIYDVYGRFNSWDLSHPNLIRNENNGEMFWNASGTKELTLPTWGSRIWGVVIVYVNEPTIAPLGTISQIFPDNQLANMIANQLGKSIEENVWELELSRVWNLWYWSIDNFEGVSNLEGVQYLTNLTSLSLPNGTIEDLTPLSGLYTNHFTTFNLSGNRIQDARPLEMFRNVDHINLNSQSIYLPETRQFEVVELNIFDQDGNRPHFGPRGAISSITWSEPGENSASFSSWEHSFSGTIFQYVTESNVASLGTIAEIFPDLNLAQMVANQLGRTVHDQVWEAELGLITQIRAELRQNMVHDLTGIELLTNLQNLTLRGPNSGWFPDDDEDWNEDESDDWWEDESDWDWEEDSDEDDSGSDDWWWDSEDHSAIISNFTTASLDLSPLSQLRNLTSLNISSYDIAGTPNLGTLTRLQNVNLSNNNLTSVDGISNLANLQWLDLSNNRLREINLDNLPSLQSLVLGWNQLTQINLTGDLNNLTTLELWGNQLGSTSDLSFLNRLPNLGRLDLSSNGLGDDKVSSILSSMPNTLWSLALGSNNLTDDADLSALQNFHNLQSLSLWNNYITDLSVFIPIIELPTLHHLDLHSNSILDLTPLRNVNRSLHYIGLWGQRLELGEATVGVPYHVSGIYDVDGQPLNVQISGGRGVVEDNALVWRWSGQSYVNINSRFVESFSIWTSQIITGESIILPEDEGFLYSFVGGNHQELIFFFEDDRFVIDEDGNMLVLSSLWGETIDELVSFLNNVRGLDPFGNEMDVFWGGFGGGGDDILVSNTSTGLWSFSDINGNMRSMTITQTILPESQRGGNEDQLLEEAISNLQALIGSVLNLTESDFTTESWLTLMTVLESAQNLLDTNDEVDASLEQIKNLISSLQQAKDALVFAYGEDELDFDVLTPEVDYGVGRALEQLQQVIDEVNALTEADFTTESWTALREALNQAIAVVAESGEFSEIQQAIQNLQTVLTELDFAHGEDESEFQVNTPELEYNYVVIGALAALQNVLTAIEDLGLTEADFTLATWTALQVAVETATSVLAESHDVAVIQQAVSALETAVNGLEFAYGEDENEMTGEMPQIDVDQVLIGALTTLSNLIAAIADYNLTEADFTAESWSNLQGALTNATPILETSSDLVIILGAIESLQFAFDALEFAFGEDVNDFDVMTPEVEVDEEVLAAVYELSQLMGLIENLVEADFNAEAWAGLMEIMAAAFLVFENSTDAEAIRNMIQRLEATLVELEYSYGEDENDFTGMMPELEYDSSKYDNVEGMTPELDYDSSKYDNVEGMTPELEYDSSKYDNVEGMTPEMFDLQRLVALINNILEANYNAGDFTYESWTAFQNALSQAKAFLESQGITAFAQMSAEDIYSNLIRSRAELESTLHNGEVQGMMPELHPIPEQPTTPEAPSTPEQPTTPEVPSTPEQPTTPEAPSTPEQPATPEVPAAPETPNRPTRPNRPARPEQAPTLPQTGQAAMLNMPLVGSALLGLAAVIKKLKK